MAGPTRDKGKAAVALAAFAIVCLLEGSLGGLELFAAFSAGAAFARFSRPRPRAEAADRVSPAAVRRALKGHERE